MPPTNALASGTCLAAFAARRAPRGRVPSRSRIPRAGTNDASEVVGKVDIGNDPMPADARREPRKAVRLARRAVLAAPPALVAVAAVRTADAAVEASTRAAPKPGSGATPTRNRASALGRGARRERRARVPRLRVRRVRAEPHRHLVLPRESGRVRRGLAREGRAREGRGDGRVAQKHGTPNYALVETATRRGTPPAWTHPAASRWTASRTRSARCTSTRPRRTRWTARRTPWRCTSCTSRRTDRAPSPCSACSSSTPRKSARRTRRRSGFWRTSRRTAARGASKSTPGRCGRHQRVLPVAGEPDHAAVHGRRLLGAAEGDANGLARSRRALPRAPRRRRLPGERAADAAAQRTDGARVRAEKRVGLMKEVSIEIGITKVRITHRAGQKVSS